MYKSHVMMVHLLIWVQVNFNGMTPLGTSLNQKVIQPFLMGGINNRNLQKPILVIIITDGEPTGEPQSTVAQVIKNAKKMSQNSQYGGGAIAFEFAQVGRDQAAQAFLGQLDRDPGGLSALLTCIVTHCKVPNHLAYDTLSLSASIHVTAQAKFNLAMHELLCARRSSVLIQHLPWC